MSEPENSPRDDARLTYALKVLLAILASAVIIVGFLDFLGHVRTVATILVGAIFLCYIIFPWVRRLNARLPLWAAILIVYAAFVIVVGVALAFIVPALVGNIRQFVHDAPTLVSNLQASLNNPSNPLAARLPPAAKSYIDTIPSQVAALLEHYGASAATHLLGVLVSTFSILALFIVIPVVALYILLDIDRIRVSVLGVFPESARPRTIKIFSEIDTVVGGFIRGQLLVAAIVGVLVIVLLEVMHVRYAILIGVFAGVIEVMPYVGAVAGAIPAVFIALFTNGWLNAVYVVVGFIVINQLEGHVISPFVVSESVGLSPLLVILALLTGGELFGLPGLLLGVPVAGLLKVLLANVLPRQAPVDLPPALTKGARASKPAVSENAKSEAESATTR